MIGGAVGMTGLAPGVVVGGDLGLAFLGAIYVFSVVPSAIQLVRSRQAWRAGEEDRLLEELEDEPDWELGFVPVVTPQHRGLALVGRF